MSQPTGRKLLAAAVLVFVLAALPTLAFALQSGDFTYEKNSDGQTATITGYTGTDRQITVPAELDGLTVTGITGGFRGNNVPKAMVFAGAMPTFGPGVIAPGTLCYYPVAHTDSWQAYSGAKQAYCLVTVDLQDGSAPTAVHTNVVSGHIAAPAVPQRIGYQFLGWYQEPPCKAAWDFATTGIADDVAVYAKWVAANCKVTVATSNTNYGTVIGGGSIAFGKKITVTAKPKAGYRFVRWMNGKTAVSTTAQFQFAADRAYTLTAEFAKIGAPAKPKAASASYSSLKLSWNAMAGAAGYEVYRATSKSGKYTKIATAATNASTSSGLTAGRSYYYKVRAKYVAAGTTTYGPYCGVFSGKSIPATPTGAKTASAGCTSIRVSWAKVSGATKYLVYRATSKNGAYTQVTTTTGTSYTNTKLKTGKGYYYKVKAQRKSGGYTATGSSCAAVYALPAPSAPTGVKAASAGSTSVKVSWSKATGATQYVISAAPAASGPFKAVATVTATSWTQTKLATNQACFYRVQAKMGSAGSTQSAVVSAKPLPVTPVLQAIPAGASAIKVSWAKDAGATGYELLSSTDGKNFTLFSDTTATIFQHQGLKTGEVRYYKARTYVMVGKTRVYSAYSAVVSTAAVKYGQIKDWFTWVRPRIKQGDKLRVIDFDTGKTYVMQSLFGHNHADVEPLTKADCDIFKSTYDGKWSWDRRAVLVYIDGIWVAGSINGEPHGDEKIKDNGMDGQVCIHFLNSKTHESDKVDPDHQYQIQRAAGMKK